MALSPGTRLGAYEVVGAIGAGGMGEVYRARDVRLERDVALKILAPSVAFDAERRARFEREAKIVAALSHPNVLALYDVGEQGGVIYAVTELLEGETLRDRLTGGPLPIRKAIDIATQIARGLAAAHARGVVHRDLKPENVFLVADGQVKVLDFGLARTADDAAGAARTQTNLALTDPGTVMGTVGYMAPEQIRGQAIDARADLFALGAVLFEMIAGDQAFRRDTAAETMTAILREDAPELPQAAIAQSAALDRIVRHCLEKSPAERFQTARDVAFALEALSGTSAVKSGPIVSPPTGTARDRRGAAALAILGLVVAALVVGWLIGFVRIDFTPASRVAVSDVRYQPVTFEEGFVFAARFAPDGRTIVYSADWERQPRDIFVTSLDSPERRALDFRGADLLSVSSSGGLALLLDSTIPGGNPYARQGTLARASLTGGAPRREVDSVWFAEIAADESIAVSRWEAQPGKNPRIEWPAGRVIAQAPAITGIVTPMPNPRVSPAGDHLAFFDHTARSSITVRIIDRAGTVVAESRPFADWWGLAWLPSGDEVWFAAAEDAGRQATVFGLDRRGRQRLIFRAPGSLTIHDISRDGRLLASFDQISGRMEVRDGPVSPPRDFTWREGGRISDLSSNGKLLFGSSGDSGGARGSVYVRRLEDPEPVRISDGEPLALSPDGSSALVASFDRPLRLSIVPTAAGLARPLDVGDLQMIAFADWLPDGRIVLEMRRKPDDPWMVYVSPAGGGSLTPLLPGGMHLFGDHSPDGRRIAAVNDVGERLVCSLPPGGQGTCAPVPGATTADNFAGWSADSRQIVLFRRYPIPARVDRVDIVTGRREPWTEIRPLESAVSGVRNVLALPDGRMVYSYERDRSQLYVISGLK